MNKNLIVLTFCLIVQILVLPKVSHDRFDTNDVNRQISEKGELSAYPDISPKRHADLSAGIGKKLSEIQHIVKRSEEKVQRAANENMEEEKYTEALQVIEPRKMYATTRVNFRTLPTTESDVMEVLTPNVPVMVTGVIGEWHSVTQGERSGYVHSNYLSNEEVMIPRNRWNIELSNDEINLLANIVWLESRGESSIGQEAVVEVVLNRIRSSQYPNSLYEVLSQRGQFSSWISVSSASPTNKEFSSIQNVLEGNTNHTTTQTLYFSTSPRNSHISAQIGNHFFCED